MRGRYVDMSNLNERFDAAWLAGLGQTPPSLRQRAMRHPGAPVLGLGQYARRPPLVTRASSRLMAPVMGVGQPPTLRQRAPGRLMAPVMGVGQAIVSTLRQRTPQRLMAPMVGLGGGVLGGSSAIGTYESYWISGGLHGALGQTPSWDDCWKGDPNFDPCYKDMFKQAQLTCQDNLGPYKDYDTCTTKMMQKWVSESCIPACEAYLRGAGEFPWMVKSSETCAAQEEINIELKKQGFCPITVDCKLGPRTCGAADAAGMGVPASCIGHEGDWKAPAECPAGDCPPPQVLVAGNCVLPAPTCGEGEELREGKCQPIVCPAGQARVAGVCRAITPKKAGMGATGWALAGLAVLGLGGLAYAAARKKKPTRRGRRRR